jgi:hypothetical protein
MPTGEIKVDYQLNPEPKKKKSVVFNMEENLEMEETMALATKQGVKDWMDTPTGVSTGIDLGKWPKPNFKFGYGKPGMLSYRSPESHYEDYVYYFEKKYKPIKKGKSKMYNVQFVAGHRVNKSSPEVLVKWYGFECPTWETWSNVKNTVNAKAYAKDESLTFEDKCIVVKIDEEISEEIV